MLVNGVRLPSRARMRGVLASATHLAGGVRATCCRRDPRGFPQHRPSSEAVTFAAPWDAIPAQNIKPRDIAPGERRPR